MKMQDLKPPFFLTAMLAITLLGTPGWAQNQHELNQKADREFRQADQELNAVWKQLMPTLTPEVKKKLTDSQVLWIKFRDAEAAAKAENFAGGSMAPMIYSYSLKTSTKQRTKELKAWLEH